jgi:hypothetical protein
MLQPRVSFLSGSLGFALILILFLSVCKTSETLACELRTVGRQEDGGDDGGDDGEDDGEHNGEGDGE